MKKIFFFSTTVNLFCIVLFGQGNYDQHDAFAPMFYPSYGDEIRSASGNAGPKYWQNSADYKINATLDDINNSITGDVIITYKNNSPEKLPFVWLQLDQNIYKAGSRSVAATTIIGGRWANRDFDGGYNIKSVKVIMGGREEN